MKTTKKYWLEVREVEGPKEAENLFLSLYQHSSTCYWLDSNRLLKNEPNRYSFMGSFEAETDQLIYYSAKKQEVNIVGKNGSQIIQQKLFDYLRTAFQQYEDIEIKADLPFGFKTGFVGYLGYELKADFDYLTTHESDLPDAALFFSTRTIAIDHNNNQVYLLALTNSETQADNFEWMNRVEVAINENNNNHNNHPAPFVEKIADPIIFSLSQDHAQYLDHIHVCKQKIIDGESYEICLTNRVQTEQQVDPINLYRFLRRNNPAPYSAFLKFNDFSILSSSPEQFLKVKKDGWISTKPIKGTIEKSDNPTIDFVHRNHLRDNEKDRAENLMIVDLLRNDLGKVCEIGSVSVPLLMDIESYETLHQLVSTVKGKLKPELNLIDCLEATFPGGSITGAPKIRTMEIIDQLESEHRGVYTGSIGYLSLDQSAELNIAIRTAIVYPQRISVGVGGAITFLSDPEQEFKETIVKAYPLIKTIVLACKGDFNAASYQISNCPEKYVNLDF